MTTPLDRMVSGIIEIRVQLVSEDLFLLPSLLFLSL